METLTGMPKKLSERLKCIAKAAITNIQKQKRQQRDGIY